MLENYLLYFSILGGIAIIVIILLIIIRVKKDIERMDKDSRNSAIKYIRKTSKYNKSKRKKLKF